MSWIHWFLAPLFHFGPVEIGMPEVLADLHHGRD